MSVWRITLSLTFDITSEDLNSIIEFPVIRNGPNGNLLSERIALDTVMGRDRLDHLIAWKAANPPGSRWSVNGATAKSGVDGEFVLPSTFRSDAVALTNADVGSVIRIPPGQMPPATRGHYKIQSREGPNEVTVEGILPVAATDLTFDIDAQAEFLATLISTV